MKTMDLVDRYIYAVTQKVPQAQRKDIADELRGLIEDMLDERAEESTAKENNIEEVLLELGSPRELADKYRGTKKYLIGPALFDTYVSTLKIVLVVVSVGIGIGFIIPTVLEPSSILDYFFDMIVSLFCVLSIDLWLASFG